MLSSYGKEIFNVNGKDQGNKKIVEINEVKKIRSKNIHEENKNNKRDQQGTRRKCIGQDKFMII